MILQTGLGINIEANRLSMVYLNASFKGAGLAAHAVYDIEEGVSLKERVEKIGTLVAGFMKNHRISSTDIFLGIPRNQVILRYIDLPSAVKENMRETLGYEMEKYSPFPAHETCFDYRILTEDRKNNSLKVLIVLVKKDYISPYFDLKNHLEAGISGIEITSTAISNYFSFKPERPDHDAFAFACRSGHDLELGLVNEGSLRYSRSINTAEDQGDPGSLMRQELERLRETAGEDGKGLKTGLCVTDAGDKLLSDLGKNAGFKVFPADLSRTGLPAHTLIPAYGLALKGIRKASMDINLMPVDLRKRAGRAGYYAMFVLAGLLILSFFCWGGGHLLKQKIYMNRLDSEIGRLNMEASEMARVRTRFETIEARIGFLNGLREGRGSVLDILKELSRRIPEDAWVYGLTFEDGAVQLEGYAVSASELIPALEASPFFKDAGFLSAITKSRDGRESFRIGVKII